MFHIIFGLGSKCSRERKFLGTNVPESEVPCNFRSRQRKYQGAKVPPMVLSLSRAKVRERKYVGTKVPVTVALDIIIVLAYLLSPRCVRLSGGFRGRAIE